VKKWTSILIACLALGLVAAGCGDDDDSSDSGSANTAAETAAAPQGAATAPASGEVVDVDIKDVKFNPKDLTIKKGETVKWTNSDGFAHDVTKEGGPGPDFKSKTLEGGDTFEQTFDTAGKIDYLCTIHSGQTGTITVK
jgi:plastocyanin